MKNSSRFAIACLLGNATARPAMFADNIYLQFLDASLFDDDEPVQIK